MKTYTNNDLWDCGEYTKPWLLPPLEPGMTSLNDPVEIKPRCEYYHYSNPRSQGALICETSGFPAGFFKDTESYLPEDELKRFAKVALNLPCTPTHVRVVHWYNVATGYSCPTVEAIYPKQ